MTAVSDIPLEPSVVWHQDGCQHHALWHSESGVAKPQQIMLIDAHISADQAFHLASQGQFMLYQGDYHQAKQLLNAIAKRCQKKSSQAAPIDHNSFHRHRMAQAQRARTLGRLLVPLQADWQIPLRRAPDVALACQQVLPVCSQTRLLALRELLGLIAAYEWRKNGVWIEALDNKIYPHYGVYSPIRGEYLDLIAQAPLQNFTSAMDVGTGTGVIAAILAKRGIRHVIATDNHPRALACASQNIACLEDHHARAIQLIQCDLFAPEVSTDLIVCNPPWLPAKPSAPIEQAVYDEDSNMLQRFLAGATLHLNPQGEIWLIMSNLAELLMLRPPQALTEWIEKAGLRIVQKMDCQPRHAKANDANDVLFHARRHEVTSLYRLCVEENRSTGNKTAT